LLSDPNISFNAKISKLQKKKIELTQQLSEMKDLAIIKSKLKERAKEETS